MQEILESTLLTQSLSDDECARLYSLADEKYISQGKYIFHQDSSVKSLFILVSGVVKLTQRTENSSYEHQLTILHKGDVFGELTQHEQQTHTTSAIALKDCCVLEIPWRSMQTLANHEPHMLDKFYQTVTNILDTHLQKATVRTTEKLNKELENLNFQRTIGNLIIYILSALCLFVFFLDAIVHLVHSTGTTAIITAPILIVLLSSYFVMIKRSGYPMSFYGFTLSNWQKSVKEGILFSLPIMGIILLIKWLMITFIPEFYSHDLFSMGRNLVRADVPDSHLYVLLPLLYAVLSTPIQEILFRGGLQGLLQSFLIGKYRFLLAILVSNLIFGITHLVSASEGFVIVTLLLGLFWGWLYQRHASLVGVIVSHMLIGVWAFFIVGIEIMVRTLDLFP